MIYQFKHGAHIPKDAPDAETTGALLVKVAEDSGELTAPSLARAVEADEFHPLRPWFTWDQDEIATKLHNIEAGTVIRAVVVSEVVPEQTTPVRAFVLTHGDEDGEKASYRPTVNVLSRQDEWLQVLQQVRRERAAFERKLDELLALAELVVAPKGEQN